MRINDLTGEIIDAAIEVHRALGPGLLESAYEECLCHELGLRNILYERQMELPLNYKGIEDYSRRDEVFIQSSSRWRDWIKKITLCELCGSVVKIGFIRCP